MYSWRTVPTDVTTRAFPASLQVDCDSEDWLHASLRLLDQAGFLLMPGFLSAGALTEAHLACANVRARLEQQLGDRLERTRRRGESDLRLPMKFDPFFLRFLEDRRVLGLVDAYLSPSAILRFQQVGIIADDQGAFRPGPWHMNFRRVLNGYRAALEVGFAIDDVDEGMYLFALGSQQRTETPDESSLHSLARTFPIPAGTMFVFDSTLWHREAACDFAGDRHLVMHQFTQHFVKPHFDHVRALGADVVCRLPARTRRLLGWDSRVPASLDEFYVEASERVYLPEQG
jgi:ectoine hydroxylase-related dioxygenase (phytanoyl-CoA dioxygenase family)